MREIIIGGKDVGRARQAAAKRVPASQWTARQVGRFKPLLFVLCLYPIGRWVWLGLQGDLTANPPEFLIRSSGVWALVLLCLTLAVTPLRRWLDQPALVRCRRMLGLFAFFYTALHVLAWAFWDRGGSLAAMAMDIVQRPLIAIGVVATVAMAALALTSTKGWMRRLGRGWQRLHWLIYPIAVLSVWHFWLIRAGKNNFFEPYVYGGVVAVLLLLRVVWSLQRRPRSPRSA